MKIDPPTAATNPLSPPDRYRGCLLGLAVGDALGTTLEFKAPGTFAPLTDLVGGGPFALQAGQWADDTSMALCLAESLVERGGFDAGDQMRRHVRWWRKGYLSSTGICFDVGVTVSAALSCFLAGGEGADPFAGSTDPQTAGNGSLMRLAPVPMFFAGAGPAEAIARAAASSRTTHGAPAALDACRYLAALILGALHGACWWLPSMCHRGCRRTTGKPTRWWRKCGRWPPAPFAPGRRGRSAAAATWSRAWRQRCGRLIVSPRLRRVPCWR